MVVALVTKRGSELPRHSDVAQAEEVHAAPLWALGLAVLTVVELAVIAVVPLGGLRVVMAVPALILLAVTALAWGGFHYRFTTHGVEISTLGFRLRSIPLESIKAYAVAPWNPMGGYGIRGMGERRAYLLGEPGGSTFFSHGEVFPGPPGRENHERPGLDQKEPERNEKKRSKRNLLIPSGFFFFFFGKRGPGGGGKRGICSGCHTFSRFGFSLAWA